MAATAAGGFRRYLGTGKSLSFVMRPSWPLVIELEIWSQPGLELEPDAGKEIGPRCCSELRLPEGIVLGLSAIPDPIDAQNLRSYLVGGELSYPEFQEFCVNRGLPADVSAIDSAARFLAYSYGVPLAWVHLPASSEGLEFGCRILLWARSHKYCLVEPSAEYCFIEESSLDHLLTSDA